MPNPHQVKVNSGDNLLLVGSIKGAFLFRSDGSREKWEEAGPYFPGRSIYAMAYDGRNGRQRLWAAVNSSYWGSFLSSSDDFGKTWTDPENYNIKFPEGSDVSLKQIWQITPAPPTEPDTLFCGVEPAALFKSTDTGATWELERGLFDHPHRPQWMPGGFACTRSFPILRTSTACSSRFQPVVSIAPTMAAKIGSPAIRAFVPSSCLRKINSPSGVSVCTRL